MAAGTRGGARATTGAAAAAANVEPREDPALEEILRVLTAARDGDFSVRLRARRRALRRTEKSPS
ncbi:MAG TPA: hypothetical protein VNT54_10215, partial [Solirubrobacteraceae bacterium]|nr:hypothetical protein [Solirubrobacteraceae bacterium]